MGLGELFLRDDGHCLARCGDDEAGLRQYALLGLAIVIAVLDVGLALRLVWGLCTQQVLVLQGMKTLTIPWGTIVAVVVGSAVVGIVAALLPALHASRMNLLAAIAHE
ncbi:hypothetical protein GCM10022206_41790 [Streptomyces chiangmaiensis]